VIPSALSQGAGPAGLILVLTASRSPSRLWA